MREPDEVQWRTKKNDSLTCSRINCVAYLAQSAVTGRLIPASVTPYLQLQ